MLLCVFIHFSIVLREMCVCAWNQKCLKFVCFSVLNISTKICNLGCFPMSQVKIRLKIYLQLWQVDSVFLQKHLNLNLTALAVICLMFSILLDAWLCTAPAKHSVFGLGAPVHIRWCSYSDRDCREENVREVEGGHGTHQYQFYGFLR